MAEIKETKAQKVERLKREKNSWEHLDEIRSFACNGFSSIPPEWLGTYFRSWGVYTQGDGAGVTGGVGGEGKSTPFFMVRIRIPNGLLNTTQLRTDRRDRPTARTRSGRHYRAPECAAALGDDRIAALMFSICSIALA